MRVTLESNRCVVEREDGDPRFRRGGWGGSADSHFLYHIKLALNAQGNDFIKRRMHRDGHLMGDDETQYLRTRSPKSQGENAAIYMGRWQLESAAEEFNREGRYELDVARPVWRIEEGR